jgi:hypothetical protein
LSKPFTLCQLLALIIFATLFSPLSFGDDLLLFVHSPHDLAVLSPPSGRVRRDLERLVSQSGIPIKVVDLVVDDIDEIGPKLLPVIQPKDSVRGIMIDGHGSQTKFVFSDTAVYQGAQFSQILSKTLASVKLAPQLTILFSSCLNGCDLPNGWSFQREFFGKFPQDLKDHSPESISVLAHEYPTNQGALHKPGIVGAMLFKAGIAKKLESFSRYGARLIRSAPAYGIIITSVTPALLGIFLPLYIPVSDHFKEALFFSGIGYTVFTFISQVYLGKLVREMKLTKGGQVEVEKGILRSLLRESLNSPAECNAGLMNAAPLVNH